MSRSYRVMVVDDSAVVRGLLVRALDADPAISVVASVPDGLTAIKRVERDEVDVVVLDIEMPVMDGLTALPKIIEARPGIQVIVASTLTRRNAEISLRALRAGAADYIAKPSSAIERNSAEGFHQELIGKVKALGAASRVRRPEGGSAASPKPRPASRSSGAKPAAAASKEISLRPAPAFAPRALAVGSSTGGPQALHTLFDALPPSLQVPVFLVQHMPPAFTSLLAEHLSRHSAIPCTEGVDGEVVRSGHAYLAPGDYHMEVAGRDGTPIIKLNQGPQENYCRPAVDPTLRSLVKVYGGRVLVVILTGMGSDGQHGAQAIVDAGGAVIAQDEESSVVWGMPGAVATAGLCSAVLPLDDIAPYLKGLLMRSAA